MTTTSLTPKLAAEACHVLNNLIKRANGEPSMPDWPKAPAWMRESSIEGIAVAMEALRLHGGDIARAAAHQHDEWAKGKILDGWKHGDVRDDTAKTHPDLVPWEKTPEMTRRKDVVFLVVVQALLLPLPEPLPAEEVAEG